MQLNTKHTLGIILLTTSLLTTTGALNWILGYWDTQYQETYREHDIYYFPSINIYGIDNGKPPQDWPYNTALQGCRNQIDSWLDQPKHIETYNDYQILQQPGFNLYYAVKNNTTTSKWVELDQLKQYLDTQTTTPPNETPTPPTIQDHQTEKRRIISSILGFLGTGLIITGEGERRKNE